MKMRLLGGVCVALACSAWAAAETLDEAIDRLAKAAAGTRDLTVKLTIQGAMYQMPDGGGKAVKSATISGTLEFQVLRDGGKCLLRATASIAEERHGKDPAAPPDKREQSVLVVNDGRFLWREGRRSGRDEAEVVKGPAPAAGGFWVERGSIAFFDAAYKTTGIKGQFDKAGEADIKLAGKGTVAGRPTTTIEMSMKAKDETLDVMMPVRFVVQFDDATGAAISGQDINGAGDVLMGFAATEVKANSGLDKKLFAYTPPEGAKVHDETQEAEKATLPKMPEPEKKAP